MKVLSSYLGAVNQLTKLIPRLAQITEPSGDQGGQWDWKEKHDLAFEQVQKNVQVIIKLTHFNRKEQIADRLRRQSRRTKCNIIAEKRER